MCVLSQTDKYSLSNYTMSVLWAFSLCFNNAYIGYLGMARFFNMVQLFNFNLIKMSDDTRTEK